jgi:hypothetical protein
MKAILLLFTAAFGSFVALSNVQHLASIKDQIGSALTFPSQKPAPSSVDKSISSDSTDPSLPSTLNSASDLLRQYGEPERKEHSSNGMTVWYYPTYIVYVRNNAVIRAERAALRAAQAASVPTTSQRNWGVNPLSVGSGTTGSASTKPGWQGSANSLGSVSLGGTGVARPAAGSAAWQGTSPNSGTVSAPRSAVSSVRSSGGSGYHSGSASAAGANQWQH